MNLFERDIAVDMGTSSTLLFEQGKGVVAREPTVVAVDKFSGKILKIAGKHHCHIEQYSAHREHVERDAPLAEALKETRTYLKSNHKDKKDKSEILNKS